MRELFAQWAGWFQEQAGSPHAAAILFAMAFAESSCFPIPPDVLLIALALAKPAGWLWFAAVCTVGSAAGGLFGYGIGTWGGRPLLDRLARTHWLGSAFAPERIARIERYYDDWGVWAVAIAGFTPIPYKVFTVASGVFRLNIPGFTVASVLSRGARFFLVAWLVSAYGEPAVAFVKNWLGPISLALVILSAGALWGWRIWHVRNRKTAAAASGPLPAATETEPAADEIPS